MIESRRRFLACSGIAVAAIALAGAVIPRPDLANTRRRIRQPHDRAYGFVEDIDDRQLGEFLARAESPSEPASSCERPG